MKAKKYMEAHGWTVRENSWEIVYTNDKYPEFQIFFEKGVQTVFCQYGNEAGEMSMVELAGIVKQVRELEWPETYGVKI